MKKTLVVSLFAGPGTGKSTTAAQVFAHLKMAGVNAELVTEYAKEWAWQRREVTSLDQFYLFGKQLHRESRLYGKVDVIVTDSSPAISAFYAAKYTSPCIAEAVATSVHAVRAEREADYLDIQLVRTKPYNPAGRYQTEEQAKAIDNELATFVERELGLDLQVGFSTEYLQPLYDTIFAAAQLS